MNRREFLLGAAAAALPAQSPGAPLAPWTPGTLDIHHISTGRGNSTLFILPDGTAMLLDAGALSGASPRWTPPRPDASRTPGDWIARYIEHMLTTPPLRLDYAMLTHFHADHMGQVTGTTPASKNGAYQLTGITEVGDRIPIRKMLDRGWPDYRYPAPLENAEVQNYRAFLEAQAARSGMRVERFQPGRNDQIVLARSPGDYPDFEIRNLAANGDVWTGTGTATRRLFPPLETIARGDLPSENMCSAGFRLRYGKFRYYTGGDIPGIPFEGFPEWHDVESPVAKVVGPVNVAVLDHHGYIDSMNATLVGVLRPRVWIFFCWDSAHPTARVYSRLCSTRIYPGPRDIFATDLHDANKLVIVDLAKVAGPRGHIVVRVAPGGSVYNVLRLDDSAETFRVASAHGPYECG